MTEQFTVTRGTEGTPVVIDTATTREQAQAIADDWNQRYKTTDPRFADHATVRPA